MICYACMQGKQVIRDTHEIMAQNDNITISDKVVPHEVGPKRVGSTLGALQTLPHYKEDLDLEI